MPYYYVLPATANQFFEVQRNGHLISFRLHMFRDRMYISSEMDNESVLSPRVATGNSPILPKNVERLLLGNFMFVVAPGVGVDYTKFGTVACRFAFIPSGDNVDV